MKENNQNFNELEIIKTMLNKTQKKVVDRGSFLLLWGWLVFVSHAANCILILKELYHLCWLPWAISMPIGVIISIFLAKKHYAYDKFTTHLEVAYIRLWWASGTAFLIIGFLGPFSPILTYKAINPTIALLAGVAIFTSAAILDWKIFNIAGLFWWIGAIVMMFVPAGWHPFIMAVIIIPGYLVPGYVIRKNYQGSENA